MSLPEEVTTPISEFLSKNRIIIILFISLVFIGYASLILMFRNKPTKVEVERISDVEAEI